MARIGRARIGSLSRLDLRSSRSEILLKKESLPHHGSSRSPFEEHRRSFGGMTPAITLR
jgi:hypothetical protein